MNEGNIILRKRNLNEVGLDLYFYNVRSLMIYEYEVLYQLSDGIWSRRINPDGHEIPWINANLFLTQGKSNARNVVGKGFSIPKNDYNLHRIMSTSTSLNRIKIIGRLCDALDEDTDLIMSMLNEGFHELDYDFDELSNDSYEEFISILLLNGLGRSSSILEDNDLFDSIVNTEYTYHSIRDDIGMIQNTMRTIIKND